MHLTHIANPVRVCALRITSVEKSAEGAGHSHEPGTVVLTLADGTTGTATPAMTARHTPVSGDYLVTQEDDYVYVNPKDVFERKYRPLEPNEEFDTLALSLELSGHRTEISARDDRIADLEAALDIVKGELSKVRSDIEREIRHSLVMQLIPNRSNYLAAASAATKFVMDGVLPVPSGVSA